MVFILSLDHRTLLEDRVTGGQAVAEGRAFMEDRAGLKGWQVCWNKGVLLEDAVSCFYTSYRWSFVCVCVRLCVTGSVD